MNTHKSKIYIHLNYYKHTKKYFQLKNLMQISVTNQYIIH